MAASNNRDRSFETVHHLVSRIAHRVYFLKEDERNDFIDMMYRSAEFVGIRLIGWIVMTNHFHILAYLPAPQPLPEAEVVRRVGVLKGPVGAKELTDRLNALRAAGKSGAKRAEKLLNRYRSRMYDIADFMQILKQWCTEDYNRRNSHVGTLWESVYQDRLVPKELPGLSRVLAYINLNAIKAAVCTGFDEYRWSSLHAAVHGDAVALSGLRFVYGEEDTTSEIIFAHHRVMSEMLKDEKRRRAWEIVRKRAAGYEVPADPLTDEALLAQFAEHYKRVVESGVTLAENAEAYRKCAERRKFVEMQIVDILRENAFASTADIAKTVGIAQATVYKYLKGLVAHGVLSRPKRGEPWSICEFYI